MSEQTSETLGDGPFLTTREAARFLKLKPNTLEKMRVYGGGPIYRKHGRHVRYHIDDLNDWSNLRKKDSTSDV
ncbi:helix-turn-helix domain-containing protein [Labrenzia sp. DG1229]|uniref:helix-turn-helix domain-containing protein n=1 Tax=Labrenzia sp. DG1229 TaxID=681847 RepID=UPI0005617EEA|nr:helix-turn-helix domain-containing protein [Labrenzia sp. DG1229]MBG6211001.1 excisionase family DNA binding protein [Labrenzia sp. EL_126]